jgi:phage/plasmid-associated DNA primase
MSKPIKNNQPTKPLKRLQPIKGVEFINLDKCSKLLQKTQAITEKLRKEHENNVKTDEDSIKHMWNVLYQLHEKADDQGIIKTKYQVSELSKKYTKLGRLYAVDSISLQSINKIIRHTIAADCNLDIDMQNAHPTIILSMCKKHKLDKSKYYNLNKYITSREEILKSTMEELKIDRDQAKVEVLKCINGGGLKLTKKSNTLYNVFHEVKELAIYFNKVGITSHYKDQCSDLDQAESKKFQADINNRMLIAYVNEVEASILELAIEYFASLNIQVGTRQFDGFFINKQSFEASNKDLNEVLADLSTYIYQTKKIVIQFTNKLMDLAIYNINELPNDTLETSSYVPKMTIIPRPTIDFKDVYDLSIMEGQLQDLTFENYDFAVNFVKANFERCALYFGSAGGFIIKKNKTYHYDKNPYLGKDRKINYLEKDVKTRKNIKKTTNLYNIVIDHIKPYSGFDHYPDSSSVPQNHINLYQGNLCYSKLDPNYSEERDLPKIKNILYVLKELWANNNEVDYLYLLSWFKMLICEPSSKNITALYLCSPEGTGKNYIIDFIAKYVTGHQNSALFNDLEGGLLEKHQTEHVGKRLVFINEISAGSSSEFISRWNKIKTYVTEKTMMVNPKGDTIFQTNNFMGLVFSTNNKDALYITQGSRRYSCFDISTKEKDNVEFWNNAFLEYNQEAGNIFYQFLLRLDSSKLPNCQVVLKNEALQRNIETSYNNITRFFNELLTEDTKLTYNEIQAINLYNLYREYCKVNGEERHISNNNKFSTEAKKLLTVKRKNNGNYYIIPSKYVDSKISNTSLDTNLNNNSKLHDEVFIK